MPRWVWFAAGTALITCLTVAAAVSTGRVLQRRLGERWPQEAVRPTSVLGLSRLALYANAAGSQGLLLALLAAVIVLTGVPLADLGITADDPIADLLVGVGLGVVLAGLNEGLQLLLDRLSVPYDESLRRLLAPASAGQWVLLIIVVLPIVAVFEELLFRGALIGGLAVGLSVSPWLLALVSSALFAIGHGLQGVGGLLAAGALGLALAGAFVTTGSLTVVIVAHYLVNLLEFVRHRGSDG